MESYLRYAVKSITYQESYRKKQLDTFIEKVSNSSDVWAERLSSYNGCLASLPILTRKDIQQLGDKLYIGTGDCLMKTSGSTGNPIVTPLSYTDRDKVNIPVDELLSTWHGKSNLSINIIDMPEDKNVINLVENSIDDIWEKLKKRTERLIYTTPTMAFELAKLSERLKEKKSFDQIRTCGEVIKDEHRETINKVFNAKMVGIYGCEEAGMIAIQCQTNNHYHVMPSMIVEIVDNYNNQVKVGETGRVLITCFSRNILPIIRYEIGDMAIAGDKCSCGITLPIIEKVIGRERSMINLPNGKQILARLTGDHWTKIAPIIEYKVTQKIDGSIEAIIVMEEEMTSQIELELIDMLKKVLSEDLTVKILQVKKISKNHRWKRIDIIREDSD